MAGLQGKYSGKYEGKKSPSISNSPSSVNDMYNDTFLGKPVMKNDLGIDTSSGNEVYVKNDICGHKSGKMVLKGLGK